MSTITMRDRLLALLCGVLLGAALRAGWERFQAPAAQAPPAQVAAQPAQAPDAAPPKSGTPARCAGHPIKMPCLSDQ
jgi:predicted negative regulator of RcsB-dependent stress response